MVRRIKIKISRLSTNKRATLVILPVYCTPEVPRRSAGRWPANELDFATVEKNVTNF